MSKEQIPIAMNRFKLMILKVSTLKVNQRYTLDVPLWYVVCKLPMYPQSLILGNSLFILLLDFAKK